MDAESLFVVGNELFLENFPNLVLFSCSLFDNLAKAGIFDAFTQSVKENVLAVSSQTIIVGERVALGKFTMGLAKSGVKIIQTHRLSDLTHMRHSEGPNGWVEFAFSGHKLRLIMKSRQNEVVSLVGSHRGGGAQTAPHPQPSQPATRLEPVAKQEEISEMMAQLEEEDPRSSSDNLLEKEEAIKEMMAEYNK